MAVLRSLPLPTVRTVEPYAPKPEWPDTFPAGRCCTQPGCITVLNRYNPGPFCLLHADGYATEITTEISARTRRRRRARARELAAA